MSEDRKSPHSILTKVNVAETRDVCVYVYIK